MSDVKYELNSPVKTTILENSIQFFSNFLFVILLI